MKLKSLIAVLFVSLLSINANANADVSSDVSSDAAGAGDTDWTGGNKNGMYSDVIIKDIHTGVVDLKPYFCVEVAKTGLDFKACLVRGYSVWSGAYDTFYNQAMYYYSTGQKIRLYYDSRTWSHAGFAQITQNAIAGFSTCSSDDYCFGPARKPSGS
ncbi:subtilase family AB5 toxin binding subunit [Escherichia coli]|uniref:subtilase family AB5 toxin binding subunit n=1 Tax=Escherichia coli TaxID=562 RepID=UPI000738FCA3|nr:subtilase family AB5 toxin binding subunit [Escherichia coli]ALP46900.1 putative toxin binding subunit [Escherichia phage Rac-SA53]EEQ3000014.1 subtilase cytotoxin subunit B [Escherichia coli]EEX7334763.1 subtilase cytotoxin subunit B [Escherichia coli]EFM6804355.1 subtilase cytotoxin subunit B [Escherichia coli]EFT5396833.1 subtilase cytotoxin subunit B [Escherichia coli]